MVEGYRGCHSARSFCDRTIALYQIDWLRCLAAQFRINFQDTGRGAPSRPSSADQGMAGLIRLQGRYYVTVRSVAEAVCAACSRSGF